MRFSPHLPPLPDPFVRRLTRPTLAGTTVKNDDSSKKQEVSFVLLRHMRIGTHPAGSHVIPEQGRRQQEAGRTASEAADVLPAGPNLCQWWGFELCINLSVSHFFAHSPQAPSLRPLTLICLRCTTLTLTFPWAMIWTFQVYP